MRSLLPSASNPFSASSLSLLISLERFHFHSAFSPSSSLAVHPSAPRTTIRTTASTSTPSVAASVATDSTSDRSVRYAASRSVCPRFSVRSKDTLHLLDEMPQPNNSVSSFRNILSWGFRPDQMAYRKLVSACATSRDLGLAEQLYALVMKDGFLCDGYVCSGLIGLFSKHGRFDNALEVFWKGGTSNVVCWNAIIAGAVRNGENSVALDLLCQMVNRFCLPNLFTMSSVLCACAAAGTLDVGKEVHAWVIKRDAETDIVVATGIVDMYAKCGVMDAAMKQFSLMPACNVVSWTSVISGFVQQDELSCAMMLFKQMLCSGVEINKCTMTSVLLGCSKSLRVKETDQVHCLIMKRGLNADSVVKDALLSTYAKLGDIQSCLRIFEESDTVTSATTWSAMLSGLVQNQCLLRSMQLFRRMFGEGLKPDKKCCSVVLSAVDSVEFGKQIHSYVIKDGSVHDVLVGSALFTMYSKCGSLKDSYRFFIRMHKKDRVSWTSMISGFAGYGHANEAFQLFRNMTLENIVPDQMTISATLMACNGELFLKKGKELHGYAIRTGFMIDPPLASALVSMYLQCKDLVSAKRVFDGVSRKDQIMWSSLVSGCASNGYSEEALTELLCLAKAGFEVDLFVCSSILGLCANLWKPSLGEQLHAFSVKADLISYLSVKSALLTLYSKCGRLDDSRRVFDETKEPDLLMWTSMVDAYAQHGSGVEALKIFELMKATATRPDYVTFVSVLAACSRNGLVEEGFHHFNSISCDYGIEPGTHHFACMVDLLGRSGRLKEAAAFISRMPIQPDFLVWSTFLGACKLHGDIEFGKLAAKRILELEPRDSGTFISLSNLSADSGDWEGVSVIRSSMKGRLKKEAGWSIT